VAEDGSTALSTLEKESFDLVILNLKIPGLSGEHYLALEPWRADANDDDKVDFQDYVIMAKNWLKEILWPFE